MAEAIETAGSDSGVRCIVITGAPGGFCAGNDIGDFVTMAQGGALGAPILRFLYALARSETPLVAAVSGTAVGVGTTMLLHCDHVIAAADAKLSTPFVALGLVPEAASSLIAARLMGHARAFSLLVMAEPLSAEEAKAAGIVNAIVPPEELEAAARAAAEKIAALPPEGVRVARRLMRGTPDEIVARIDEEAEAFKQRLTSPDAQAAFMAFLSRKR
jgi:enoyl-CoA hydratase/carnithine racemase